MIKRLTLQNWRNYENITVEFGAGTTFVIAPNGVGKTSLVEAARWALFGRIALRGNSAIRAGSTSACAIVEVELPDLRVLSVERTLTSKQRGADTAPVVHLDGAPVPEKELTRHLVSAYSAEPGFLAGLTMPAVDRDHDVPTALGLEEHLSQYYRVDSLRNAVSQLKTMQKANQASIKQIKEANSISSRRLAELHDDMEQTARHVEEATEQHRAVMERLDRARERERRIADIQQWQDNYSAWKEAAERLAVQVSADVGMPVSIESIESALNERLAELDQQIEAARVGAAVNAVKEQVLTANDERLATAHEDCPVCRRPLDAATVASAHQVNAQEISAIRASILELGTAESDLLARRESVKAAQTEWRRIPQPGKPPQPAAADDNSEPIPLAQLLLMAEAALSALVEARAAQVRATKDFHDARAADEAMHELEALFRREAHLRVAIEATEATLRELLNETIRPLAAEVNQRWKAWFPDRGDLNTYPDGRITRTVNGHQLPYDSFSTGETMGATIVLRLLVAEMATTTDFCWFDEPLEHLDPDVRRKVASLLSRVTSGESPIKQLVVTTYEEQLARHLRARDEQWVSLLDVRQAG